MSLYVDSSALLKRYVDEPDSDRAEEYLQSEPLLVTGRHTVIEVRRNLSRLLDARPLAVARRAFADDVDRLSLVEIDAQTCATAADIAETTIVRTLDALHLASAQRALGAGGAFLTFDIRQAQAARSMGFVVLGA
jgi:uncharacterized protein